MLNGNATTLVVRCFAVGGTLCAGKAFGQTTIINLGVLPDGGGSQGYALSADGSVAAGSSSSSCSGSCGDRAFRWTTSGMQDLGSLSGSCSYGLAISADGLSVAGWTCSPSDRRAFRWTGDAGMQSLGILSGGWYSEGYAISADGSVEAGWALGWSPRVARAFRWTAAEGMQSLGALPGGDFSQGFGMSTDGLAVTGYSDSAGGGRAFRWTAGEGMRDLGVLPGWDHSYGYAISGDGSAVAGYSYSISGGGRAFRWTVGSGMQDLGVLPGGSLSQARGLSSDGSIVVGWSDSSAGQSAILWTAALGMVDLNTYLPVLGVDLAGWTRLTDARGVSADGSAIIGTGIYEDQERAWVVRGPCVARLAVCPGDLDCSGSVTPADLASFVNTWFASQTGGTVGGDFNGDHVVDPADVASFVNLWFASIANGC